MLMADCGDHSKGRPPSPPISLNALAKPSLVVIPPSPASPSISDSGLQLIERHRSELSACINVTLGSS